MKRVGLSVAVFLGFFALGATGAETACQVSPKMQLSARDATRLERLQISRSQGLAAALVSTNANERAVVSELFASEFTPIKDREALFGDYKCRTIKMGGILPLTVYGWFDCEINVEEGARTISKTSGSQRFFGLLFAAGNGLAYRGALHYGYETGLKYYGDDEERDQVGCLSALDGSATRLVLEMPAPYYESVHDVIELVRIK